MSEPSKEAIEAARRSCSVPFTAEGAVRKAYPIIRADVAREIAEWLRGRVSEQVGPMQVSYRPVFGQLADEIEREFGPLRDEEEK